MRCLRRVRRASGSSSAIRIEPFIGVHQFDLARLRIIPQNYKTCFETGAAVDAQIGFRSEGCPQSFAQGTQTELMRLAGIGPVSGSVISNTHVKPAPLAGAFNPDRAALRAD